jgi:hypothetical protein
MKKLRKEKPMPDLSALREALQLGLSVVLELWNYETKDWVTSVHAADINNDGDIEILVGSRDGRIHGLTNKGKCLWECIVGNKQAIGDVLGIVPSENEQHPVCVLVGTQDGKVYGIDERGQMISRKRPLSPQADRIDHNHEEESKTDFIWQSFEYEVRRFSANLKISPQIVIDSENQ